MHGHIVLGCPRYSPMELITLTIAIIISMAQVWPSACVTSSYRSFICGSDSVNLKSDNQSEIKATYVSSIPVKA